MNISDVFAVLQWWLIIFVIGLGFLPLTVLFFSRFFDKGYIFSKTLGVAITSYTVFLFGVLHILPFSQISSAFIALFIIAILYYFLPMKWRVIYLLKHHWPIFVLEEALFLIALFIWAYIHSFNPDIHGLEKYMDFGFINSILRSDFFPPIDMWFPPFSINYYYYGHFVTAFLTKLSGVAPALSFNIMLSTIFAWCFTQSFSIGINLFALAQKLPVKKFKLKLTMAGLLTAALVTFAGNLHIIYAFFTPYQTDNPKPVWELPFSPTTFPNSYWYPNATRYIYHTIHEFPIYSWVVADLHGHVLDIPFVLLAISLFLAIFVNSDPKNKDEVTDEKWKNSRLNLPAFKKFESSFLLHPLSIILIGFLLAVMYMTNAWDGAIYLLLASLVVFYLLWERTYGSPKAYSTDDLRLLVPIGLIAVAFLAFSFPYNFYFKPFAEGIGVLCSPSVLTKIGRIGPFWFEADHCQHSFWWELLMLYGFFYFFAFSLLIYLTRSKKILRIDIFILLIILLSTFLIFLPEFIYVKDIYPAHYRANTMFKLVFQAFIMLGLASSYIFTRILHGRLRFTFFPASLVLIALVMTYPYLAVGSYYGDLKNYKGLNGMTYLQTLYPSDYEAILWLNTHIKGQPIFLEAQGDSYTDYARISANTGLPTVLGWTVHEWLWRGDYSIPAPRITDVKDIYEHQDVFRVKELLNKYQVEYVYIGDLERQKYPNLSEEKFNQLGKKVFEAKNARIYKIN